MSSLSFLIKNQLFTLHGINEIRTLQKLNNKLGNAFVRSIFDTLNYPKTRKSEFFVFQIFSQRILKRVIRLLKDEKLKVDRISADNLKQCFFILNVKSLLNLQDEFNEEIKNLGNIFKKLGYDFDFVKSLTGKSNVILVDFD